MQEARKRTPMGILQSLSRFTSGRHAVAAPAEPTAVSAEAVLARVETLCAQGRRPEALRFVLPHAVRLDAPALWLRVDALRLETALDLAAGSAGRPDWPPALPDPFPGAGLPEIEARALDAAVLGGAILHHGSLIVRGLVDPSTATRLREGVDRALDACEAHQADPAAPLESAHVPFPLPEDTPLIHGRRFLRSGGAVWATESPGLLEDILEIYRARGVLAAIEGYLGEAPMLSVGKTVLRRAEPTGRGGDFHQDGAFMGADIRTVNVWVALSDCGVDAPGLELVPRRLPGLAEAGTRGAWFDWSVGRPVAQEAAGEAGLATPSFRCGDAILFDQLMLHATYATPEMDRRRYAIESWFFAPSSYPADQVAIAI
jgi:hypothetical protein